MNGYSNGDMEKTAIGMVDMDERTQVVSQPQSNATQFSASIECPVCKTSNPPSEAYCTDCGFLLTSEPVELGEMPELAAGRLVTPDGTRQFALHPGENSVGRENSDILLSHNTVSRRHGKITVSGSVVTVEDSGSTNGTYVNGKRLENGEKAQLEDGAELVFGSMTLKYEAPETPSAESETPAEAEATTELEIGAEAGEASVEPEEAVIEDIAEPEPERVPIGRLVSTDGTLSFDLFEGTSAIGRRQGENDIAIPDPYCSGRHADLVIENGEITLTDLGSTNGTLVNGVKLDPNAPKEIHPGDEITLGRTVFRVEVA